MNRRRFATACLALLPLAFAAPARAQEKPPIKIAHTAPLSGPLALVGKLQAIAVDIGVADVNAAGGVNGSKIEILRFDDQLRPDQAVLRIREALGQNAVGIIGPVSGTQWETVNPVVNQLKMPAININANKPGITQRPYALRITNPDDTGMPEALDDFLSVYKGAKRIVVMGDVREASGKAAIDNWAELAKKKGLEIVDTLTFTSGQTDFSPLAIKLKEAKPDAVLISILSTDAVKLAREMQVQGVKAPLLGNSLIWPGTLPQTLSKTVGEDAALWHVTGYSMNDASTGDPDLYRRFVERYAAEALKDSAVAQFTPPNVANASLGYDVVAIMADILRRKGVDGATPIAQAREKLKEGMVELKEFRGVNAFKFRDTGDAYIRSRALRIDPAKGAWVFLTPATN